MVGCRHSTYFTTCFETQILEEISKNINEKISKRRTKIVANNLTGSLHNANESLCLTKN